MTSTRSGRGSRGGRCRGRCARPGFLPCRTDWVRGRCPCLLPCCRLDPYVCIAEYPPWNEASSIPYCESIFPFREIVTPLTPSCQDGGGSEIHTYSGSVTGRGAAGDSGEQRVASTTAAPRSRCPPAAVPS